METYGEKYTLQDKMSYSLKKFSFMVSIPTRDGTPASYSGERGPKHRTAREVPLSPHPSLNLLAKCSGISSELLINFPFRELSYLLPVCSL